MGPRVAHGLVAILQVRATQAVGSAMKDHPVLGASGLADQLLTPDRLANLLKEAIRYRRAQSSGMAARRTALRKELKDIEAQIDRLYTAIAEGTITDTTMLRGKLDQLNARLDECLALDAGLGMDQPDLRQALSKRQAISVAANLKQRLLDAPRLAEALRPRVCVGNRGRSR